MRAVFQQLKVVCAQRNVCVKGYRVMCFGDGSHGALGQSLHERGGDGIISTGDVYEPSPVKALPENIVRIGAGHYHSFAITDDGQLWSWGRNNEGQLGRGTDLSRGQCNHPQIVRGLKDVQVKSATGSGVVSMVIDTHGTLWAWGKSKRGQLGLGKDIIEVPFPRPVQALSSKIVTQIALGWGHALACTTDGKLYSWGYPVNGQLGYVPKDGHAFEIQSISTVNPEKQSAESYDDDLKQELNVLCQWEPQLVPLGDLEAVGVSCGDDHSLVLCRGGILLSFGDNSYGQLGRIKKKTISVKDWRVDLETCVTYIGSGLGHSLAICCDNKKDEDTTLFSWGWNAAFQLGRTTVNDRPLHVEGLEGHHICHVDGGRVHSVAIDGEGGLWTWGSGKNGRLGLGSFGDEQQPCQVESIQDLKVQQAVCGFDHTIILVND